MRCHAGSIKIPADVEPDWFQPKKGGADGGSQTEREREGAKRTSCGTTLEKTMHDGSGGFERIGEDWG